MSKLPLNRISYDPDDDNPQTRWWGLWWLLWDAGIRDDEWFVRQMEQLRLCPHVNRQLEAEILEALYKKANETAMRKSLCPFEQPHPSQLRGEIVLGHAAEYDGTKLERSATPILLPFKALMEHGLLISKTGGGKSRLMIWILLSCARHSGCFVFEVMKRELSVLVELLGNLGIALGVLDWQKKGSLYINPLQVPPNTHPLTWIAELAGIYRSSFDTPEGALRLFKRELKALYEKKGVFGGSENYPTLYELTRQIEALQKLGAAGNASREALLFRLKDQQEMLGDALACSHGLPLREMENGHWLFVFDGMDRANKTSLVSTCSGFILHERSGNPRNRKPLVLFIEEAKTLITSPSQHLLDDLEVVRGAGVSVWFVTQEAYVHETVRNAAGVKIVGKIDAPQLAALANSLSLSTEQCAWLMKHQQTQLFVMKADTLSYHEPLLFLSDDLELPEVDEATLRQSQEKILGPLLQKVKMSTTEPAAGPKEMSTATNPSPAPPQPDKPGRPQLPEPSMAYLRAIVDHPDIPSSDYDKHVQVGDKQGMGRSQGFKIRTALMGAGLVRSFLIRTGGRHNYYILRPTKTGLDLLPADARNRYLATYPDPDTLRPGVSHDHKVRKIQACLTRKGFRVKPEHQMTPKGGVELRLDLFIESPDGTRRIGCEIQETELTTELLLAKARLLQGVGNLTERYVLVPSSGARCLLEGADLGGVHVETLERFLSRFGE